MDNTTHQVNASAPGRVIVSGLVTIAANSATTSTGSGWSATKVGASTGKYRITLAGPYAALVSANAIVVKSGGTSYKVEVDAHAVTTAGGGTVDFIVSNMSSAVTPTSGLEYLAAMQFAGLYPHLDGAAGIATADATDLASSKTLAKAIADYLAAHDDNTSLHTVADAGALTCAAYASSPAEPNDLAEVNAMFREMATDWYTHALKVPAVHPGYDVAALIPLTVKPANTDQDGTNAALNALKAAINQSVRSDYPTQTFVKSATVATTNAAVDPVSCVLAFELVLSNMDTLTT